MRSVRSYQREIRNLLDKLEQMQWVQPTYNGTPSCSYCGAQQHLHTGCALARLLDKRAPRAPEGTKGRDRGAT